MFHVKASIVFVQTYTISCIEPGALVQPMGKAKCIGTMYCRAASESEHGLRFLVLEESTRTRLIA